MRLNGHGVSYAVNGGFIGRMRSCCCRIVNVKGLLEEVPIERRHHFGVRKQDLKGLRRDSDYGLPCTVEPGASVLGSVVDLWKVNLLSSQGGWQMPLGEV